MSIGLAHGSEAVGYLLGSISFTPIVVCRGVARIVASHAEMGTTT